MFLRKHMEDKTMKRFSIRKDDKAVSPVIAVILMVAITVVLAGVLYVWVTSLSTTEDKVENIVATLDQGDGNMTSGVLFVIQKGSGDSVKIADYRFKVGKEGGSLLTLKWPDDGATGDYNIDSGLRADDGLWWDATERVGFPAPSGLGNIDDGDTIEVSIINLDSGDVVYTSTFVYRE
jgi:flagellin-like protein